MGGFDMKSWRPPENVPFREHDDPYFDTIEKLPGYAGYKFDWFTPDKEQAECLICGQTKPTMEVEDSDGKFDICSKCFNF